MKHIQVTIVALVLSLVACSATEVEALMDLSSSPQYVAKYLDVTDVRRIGHALDTAPTREPVQWENGATGYQFSLMVFSTGKTNSGMIRRFSVLAIQPSGQAELLNLIGRSPKKNEWHIVAEAPAAPVGKAARMNLASTSVPKASTSSGKTFSGFMVAE